jgi:hypothetical protein
MIDRPPVSEVARRIPGVGADGRWWELVTSSTGITALTTDGAVGGTHVSERGEQVVLELWTEVPDLPPELPAHLVGQTFALPVVRPLRPVLVCLPRRDGGLLEQALCHVRGARTRAAGGTCLIEGFVDDGDEVQQTTR